MLEKNPTGLERAEIERVVDNQYNMFFRQAGLKALSASKGTITADRGEESRRPRSRIEGNCFTVEGRVAALRITGARRTRSKNHEMPPPTKRVRVGASTTSVGVRRCWIPIRRHGRHRWIPRRKQRM